MDLFSARRRRVLEAIDGVAIVPAAPVTLRNNDVEHEYRQDSDFYYLTGFDEPEAVLILSTVHAEHRAVLFVRPRDPEREVWDGARAGVDGAKERCGVDATYAIAEFSTKLPEYLSGAKNLHYELGKRRAMDERIFSAIARARGKGRTPKPWPTVIHHPEGLWHEMRLFKDEHELASMQRAAAITCEAHTSAMALAEPGRYEYEIEAHFRQVFRKNGSERPAYPPIVGSGPNATVLHYTANSRRLEDGDLLLVDAGCEYGYYASDVTRTFPVNGRFSAAQRSIYEIVLEAQLAGIELARPGSSIEKVHRACLRRLVQGMLSVGLLQGELDQIIEQESYKRYYMHRTSHWLGMDVHDVGAYFVDGQSRPFAPGMVITIEPGIYVSAEDDTAPAELRGIGVRIEDDISITQRGPEVLTAAVPKTADEVERACRG